MRILHISNDFLGSKVHGNLYSQLDSLGIKQTVFAYRRSNYNLTSYKIDFQTLGSKVAFSVPLKKIHRLLFRKKISTLYLDLKSKENLEEIDIVHATTMFTDGAVAYKLFKEYSKPYIITIRSTDTDLFFKYLIHLKGLGLDILTNASKIIFLTPNSKTKLFSMLSARQIMKLESKTQIIPNGIDNTWFEENVQREERERKVFKVLYVGTFLKRKNVPLLISAILELNSMGKLVTLDIVGGSGKDEETVKKLALENSSVIKYHGVVKDFKRIKQLYKENDLFVMPSKFETFGLVYVEALSQGIPIIYVKDEGIDGFFNENVGEKIAAFTKEEIISKISLIISNYSKYSFSPKKVISPFNWEVIALKYRNIYSEVMQS